MLGFNKTPRESRNAHCSVSTDHTVCGAVSQSLPVAAETAAVNPVADGCRLQMVFYKMALQYGTDPVSI